MKEPPTRKPILIGKGTYGYYYPDHNEFCCSHGGWCSPAKLTCEGGIILDYVDNGKEIDFQYIDKIPEDF